MLMHREVTDEDHAKRWALLFAGSDGCDVVPQARVCVGSEVVSAWVSCTWVAGQTVCVSSPPPVCGWGSVAYAFGSREGGKTERQASTP